MIHRAAEILAPLYDRMLARIAADAHCQADETSFRLQNRPDKRGFVWTFLAGKLVAYVFSGDRSGQTPSRLLGGTTGSLVVDAYTGYNDVTDVDGRTRAGCWSHYPASVVIRRSARLCESSPGFCDSRRKITA